MQSTVDELAKRHALSALSVAICEGDDEPRESFAGAELSNGVKRNFPIYSITKTFIATTLLKLAEAKEIDLDVSANKIIADAPAGERYTVRQLLNNTSGLPDYYSLPEYRDGVANHAQIAWTRDEYLRNTYRGKLLFNPGEGWMYSNLGYMILREVIERVTASSFGEALQTQIFSPLRLSNTRVLAQPADLLELVPATSVFISPDKRSKEVRGNYDPAWVAHGVIASSAKSVAQFFRALFRQNFLTADSLRQMTTLVRVPGNHPPAVTPSYGLGLMGDPDGKFGPSYAHGGGGPGYALHATYWPAIRDGLIAVVFTNSELYSLPPMMEEIASKY